jgi:DNA-directed RNA polymerase subunit L
MKNSALESILKDENIKEALISVRQFCELIDGFNSQDYSRDNFIDILHVRLSDLYAATILLPKIELPINKENDEEVKLERGKTDHALYRKLSELLGEYTDYSQSFDPTIIHDSENYSNGWLVDDLADIHKDLKEVISNIETENDNNVCQALWELKFGFGSHWGCHLIDALRFLHYIKYCHLYKHMD